MFEDLRISSKKPMELYCNNKATFNTVHYPVQHNKTKHAEVDCHFIKEKLEVGLICMPYMPYMPTEEPLANVLTKGLHKGMFNYLINKLGMINIFKPT